MGGLVTCGAFFHEVLLPLPPDIHLKRTKLAIMGLEGKVKVNVDLYSASS